MAASPDRTPPPGSSDDDQAGDGAVGEALADRAIRRLNRVGSILLDLRAPAGATSDADDPTVALGPDLLPAARRARHHAVLAERLAAGTPLDVAAAETVRAMARGGQHRAAYALAEGLAATVGPWLPRLAAGVLCLPDDHTHAWRQLRGVPLEQLLRCAPVEAVTAALVAGGTEGRDLAAAIAERAEELPVAAVVDLAGRYHVAGDPATCARLTRLAERRLDAPGAVPLDERQADQLRNLLTYADATASAPGEAPTSGRAPVTLGVIDYHQIDHARASRNLGDYVQTLAFLGHLARFTGLRYTGDDELASVTTELQSRVGEAFRVPEPDREVRLVPVSRDYSVGDPLPPDTWTIVFGWHAHTTFKMGYGLPHHPHVRPIYCSFHVNHLELLTDEMLEELRAGGPVGCRDWATVDLLLSAGVPAFFSGCLTTTVDMVVPSVPPGTADPDGPVAAVDLTDRQRRELDEPYESLTHIGDEFRDATLHEGIHAAIDILGRYQHEFRRVVTTRLHCYLPLTSIGVDVRFKPTNLADVRFEGLRGLKHGGKGFTSLRDGIVDLLGSTLRLVVEGADEATVRAHWAEATAERVEQARQRRRRASALEAPALDLTAALAAVRRHPAQPAETADLPGVPDLVVPLDGATAADPGRLAGLLGSLTAHAPAGTRVWLLGRDVATDRVDDLAAAHAGLSLRLLDLAAVDYGDGARPDADLLLLPALLPDTDRVVVLHPASVVEDDPAGLADLDLDGRPLAAVSTHVMGPNLWRDAGDRLAPKVGNDLRRTLAARHDFGWTTFDTSVVVLDLARLRADRFVEESVPRLSGLYRLGPWEALHAHVGGERAELPARWNVRVGVDVLDDEPDRDGDRPAVVSYARVGHPLDPGLTPQSARWLGYAEKRA